MDDQTPTPSDTFGRALRGLREQRNLTQRGLVEAAQEGHDLAGIVESALSHWERGQRVPSPPQLVVLARVLDCDSEAVLRLIELAARENTLYAGLVSGWEASGTPPEDRYKAWCAWAGTQTTRPPRGGTVGSIPDPNGGGPTIEEPGGDDTALPPATLPAASALPTR